MEQVVALERDLRAFRYLTSNVVSVRIDHGEADNLRSIARCNSFVLPIQPYLITIVKQPQRVLLHICRWIFARRRNSCPELVDSDCWWTESIIVTCDVF